MTLLFLILAACLGVISLSGVASLLFLLIVAALSSQRKIRPINSAVPLRLAVIVPAHDEELVLHGTLASLKAQRYPQDRYEVVVVADNCTDDTATIARREGVTVLERTNASERGKGHALNLAISTLLQAKIVPDGFLIVDADTWVSPDFLACMNTRLTSNHAPEGLGAWQGRYGVLNSQDGWRPALMTGAFDLVNHLKPLGREALGLSAGLKGNGMAFTHAVARRVPWPGSSLTEDLDYGVELARQFGLRIGYAPEALVLAQMPSSSDEASSQRARWEEGRAQIVRERAFPLLGEGIRRRNFLLWDIGWDLIVPPLAELSTLLFLWVIVIGTGAALHCLPAPKVWGNTAAVGVLGLLLYVLGGFRVANAPREAYAALFRAPSYILWKFVLLICRAGRSHGGADTNEWVRTARTPINPGSPTSPKVPRS